MLGRQGRILGAALSQGSPRARLGASCSHMGCPTWLCIPCPWRPQSSSCSLPWSAPGWLWELGSGILRDLGASLLMPPCPHPSVTD